MLKAVAHFAKLSFFACLVLVMGVLVRWDGKTLSDHVRVKVGTVQKSLNKSSTVDQVKDWAGKVTDDAKKGIEKIEIGQVSAAPQALLKPAPLNPPEVATDSVTSSASAPVDPAPAPKAAGAAVKKKPSRSAANATDEDISHSERQKLRDLIRELNSSR